MTAPERGPAAVAPRITYSDHLVALVARAAASAARLAEGDPDRRAEVAVQARRAGALLSARLDASPLTEATAAEVDRREAAGLAPVDTLPAAADCPVGGGWARALKLEGMPTREVAALEYANLLACYDAEPGLVERVFEAPLDALRELHGTLCRGLVDPEVVGRPRRTEQAIHDGAQGRVLYHAPPPADVPRLLDTLGGWLGGGSAALPALVVAGVVHERLLEWQPFEAANGRLARAFARLVLRARGLDAHGVAVPERTLAADPLGYFGEVAATIRRRGDLTRWLERWGEALCVALDDAAAEACPAPAVAPPRRAARFAAALAVDEAVTVADYGERNAVSRETAQAELAALERAGTLRLEPGTRGLRWRRRPPE